MTPYLSATLDLAAKLGRTPTQAEMRAIGVPKAKLGYVVYYLGLPKRAPGMRTDYTCDRLPPVVTEARAFVDRETRRRTAYQAAPKAPEELTAPDAGWMV